MNDREKGTEDYNRLHRLCPLYDSLRMACNAVCQPHQNLAVDKCMVATKAKIGLKQYINNKLTKWGIKLLVLADSNGYTVDFKIYTGKAKTVSGKGLSFDAITSLVNKEYLGSGYHIYCDNFYTSPALFRHLFRLWSLWDLQRGQRGKPGNKIEQPGKVISKRIHTVDQGWATPVCEVDGHKRGVCVLTAYSGETCRNWYKTIL